MSPLCQPSLAGHTPKRPLRRAGLSFAAVWLAAALLGAWLPGAMGAEVMTSAAKKAAEKCRPPLAAEEEEKFEQFFEKVKRAKLQDLTERMKKGVGEIQAATGIDDAHAQALQAGLQPVVNEYAESWIANFEVDFIGRRAYASVNWLPTLDRSIRQTSLYARNRTDKRPEPSVGAAWHAALERLLSPEENMAWDAARAARLRAREKEIAQFLAGSIQQVQDERKGSMLIKSGDVVRELGLARDRAKELQELSARAVEKGCEVFASRYQTLLLSLDDDLLAQYRSGFYAPPVDPDEIAMEKSAWKEGLEKLLNAEELQRFNSIEEERKARMISAVAQLMIVELDQRVAMTASQRERMLPLAEKLAAPLAERHEMEAAGGYPVFQPLVLLAAAGTARREDISPILDEVQCRHWEHVCSYKYLSALIPNPYAPANSASPVNAVESAGEPEEVEDEISAFLHEKTSNGSRQITAGMTLKAEDAARAAGLDSHAEDQLKTAAKGAAEEAKESWKLDLTNSVRVQLQNATPQNLPQRLRTIQSFYFENTRQVEPESQPLWKSALKRELTDQQLGAWKKELEARETYREASIVFWLVTEFDHCFHLSKDQREKVRSRISKIIAEYNPELSNFVTGSTSRWYLIYYTMFTPFAGVPREELKAILQSEVWDRYSRSEQANEAEIYWTNFKATHENRLKGGN